jgi:hypothetical protein
MRYAVAAEGSQELRSRGLPWRARPPELVPSGVVHALDVATELPAVLCLRVDADDHRVSDAEAASNRQQPTATDRNRPPASTETLRP